MVSEPLPAANASADGCAARCCATTGCHAWVYVDKAPSNFGKCKLGQNCCYLKNAVPAAKNNSICTSGTVSTGPDRRFVTPPMGIRSAAALGGLASGTLELRGDGTLTEWTIVNQSPAGAAKFSTQDDAVFGTWQSPGGGAPSVAKVLRTHPQAALAGQGVDAIQYQGAQPVSRLDVLDKSLPFTTSLFGYSTFKVADMDTSARPAVAFSLTVDAPSTGIGALSSAASGTRDTDPEFESESGAGSSKAVGGDAAFFFALPLSVEQNTERRGGTVISTPAAAQPAGCVAACHANTGCASWTWKAGTCSLQSDVPLNAFEAGSASGVAGTWSRPAPSAVAPQGGEGTGDGTAASTVFCSTLDRPGMGPAAGNASLCVSVDGGTATATFGGAADIATLWADFAEDGALSGAESTGSPDAIGAAAVRVSVPAGAHATLTITLSWRFPNKDYLGQVLGNHYAGLWADSEAAGRDMHASLQPVISDIMALHTPFFSSSMPDWMSDFFINSLSHTRSAMWFADGRWRQWEAYDCVNVDSVHNDGERHIPYIMLFPNSTRDKVRAWATIGQAANGMINEQLGCGCMAAVPKLDDACGRAMSDVSSMEIQYILEFLRWSNDTELLTELWPRVKKAAQWQISTAAQYGVPTKLVATYDILGLDKYAYAAYNSVFHLLALSAAHDLAVAVGDTTFAATAKAALSRGQAAMDALSWNSKLGYYNSYAGGTALMSDTFYAQVLAYSSGLGDLLLNPQRLDQHNNATAHYNDSPFGFIIQTGRYPPSDWHDNSLWQMASPNWGSLMLHRGADVDLALSQPAKSLGLWRDGLHDLWNVAGVAGGVGLPQYGLPYITSHYGYAMVCRWRCRCV